MSNTEMHSAVKRVLIYRLGSLGDTLVSLPALNLVRRAFPSAERRMLTSLPPNAKAAPSSDVLAHTGLIDGYFFYPYRLRDPRQLISLWWQILRWRPDVLVYMNGDRSLEATRRDALFFRLCGIRRLVGVPTSEDMRDCRNLGTPDGLVLLEAEGSRLARNIAELGDAQLDQPANWDLQPTAEEQIRATEVLAPAGNRPIIVASLGTKLQSNEWGLDNWHALLAQLAKLYPNHALAVLGAPPESSLTESAMQGWRDVTDSPALNLCGALNVRGSAAVLSRASVFIGHDSGPTHLAASVATPCVSIFGSRNLPGRWFPYGKQHRVLYHRVECQGCGLETCIVERKRCILSITVDEVVSAVNEVLRA
jgi:ADP-heptose:LPS heptosyltransferase